MGRGGRGRGGRYSRGTGMKEKLTPPSAVLRWVLYILLEIGISYTKKISPTFFQCKKSDQFFILYKKSDRFFVYRKELVRLFV